MTDERRIDDPETFIRAHTAAVSPPLVPEVRLHLATEVTPLWHATEAWLGEADLPPPYWAFAWPGGQALARWILDAPIEVRGRRVLDVGAGSGIVAIAAMLAGAASAVAIEEDAVAATAVRLNAALNGVAVEVLQRDATAWPAPPADLVLVGDLCYERGVADRLTRWLAGIAANRTPVLLGDPGRSYLPRERLDPLDSYDVPTSEDLEDKPMRQTTIWRFLG